MSNVYSIPIADIATDAPRRTTHDVTELARSMAEVGQLQPIILTPDLRLVAGWHRLQAAKMLGWSHIDARYVDDVDAEIAAIDENLMRHELHYVERGDWLARRKQLYEERHPETRNGANQHTRGFIENINPRASFVADTATKTGRSVPAIYQELQIATKAAPELKQVLVEKDVPKTDALKLVRLPQEAQAVAAEHIKAGVKPDKAARTARKSMPAPPRQTVLTPIPARLEVADAAHLPLEDETVDLIVTSPPYGLDIEYSHYADESEGWYALMVDWLGEAWRVTKSGGRLALNIPLDTTRGGKRPVYAQAIHAAITAGWEYQWTIVWNEGTKGKPAARGSKYSAAAPHVIAPVEMIPVFCKGDWHRQGEADMELDEWLDLTEGMWTFHGEVRAWENHPAAFPVELPRRLIKLLSFPADTVLDPFCGSGTTPLAAVQTGRRAIGFDISPQYIEAARRRLALAAYKEGTAA